MAQRSHVPKFGNWESGENVPYTAYFEKARKGRTGGKMINPNDPEENPDLVSEYAAPVQAPPPGAQAEAELVGQGNGRRVHEHHRSREDGELKQFAESPAHHDNINRRAGYESAPNRYAGRGVGTGEPHRRTVKPSAVSENSIERSPLHPHARISGRGSGAPSPAWEGKTSYDGSHGTPGRSRLRNSGDESPDKGVAVPKFGEWDENNPASADGFTHIFNKVREERHAVKVPGTPSEPSYGNARKHAPSDNAKLLSMGQKMKASNKVMESYY